MTVGRRIGLLIAAALGLTGCRAADTGPLSLRAPTLHRARKSFDVDAFVAAHNRNAEAIETLEARPSIGVAMERRRFAVDGKMALERPRNFDLELSSFGTKKGDIGSNADEFWYWIANREQPFIFWCRYDDLQSSALPVTYQPDWTTEALGLRSILPPDEAAMVQSRAGSEPGTTILSFPAVLDQGEPYTREMVISDSDRRIKKLLIYSDKPKVLIAEATPSNYQAYLTGEASGGKQETGYLPQKLKLDWKREQLVLDVSLKDVKLNQFDHAESATMFVEPVMPGYTRRNLADLSRGSRSERRVSTRDTIPRPGAPERHPRRKARTAGR